MHMRTLLAVALLSTGPMFAQEAPAQGPASIQDFAPWSMKFRALAGLGNVDGIENGLAAGVNYAIPVGPGCFNMELSYDYFFGSNYNVAIPPNTIGLTATNSADVRKHTLMGGALRLGYQQSFTDDWTWQLGVSMDYLTSHSAAHALFGYYGGAGYWDQNIDKVRLSLSPYAGVRWELNQYSALEFGLLALTYKEENIFPVYGAASVTSATSSRNVVAPKLEFAYVLKF